MIDLLICSPLESVHVERIRTASDRVRVHYHPELLPKPRFEADHIGDPPELDEAASERWASLLEQAEILFDFDYYRMKVFKSRARKVRWIQASSAGVGRFVQHHGLDAPGGPIITTAAGVHARPLAEFVIWAMLSFAKNYPLAKRQQQERVWSRFHNDDLEGKTLAIVGLGAIGREVARMAKALGLRVTGTKRSTEGVDAKDLGVDRLYPLTDLHALLSEADYVCLVAPQTPETEGMMDAAAFSAMKPGSVLINIGRGALVDESALIGALDAGQLAGAVLDVARKEPLPADSPLWTRDDVIIFPHSASTSKQENGRLTDLFLDNLARYLDGSPLRNLYVPERMY
ncbi:D-2-hydroxyacid dehydrogenase [Proteobacteria bacterium 005FR1]|nr:D-2-hydroxyacid dehydrogenase [Proteobacteria bacterium 005FR1]